MQTETAIQVEQLVKHYPGVRAVDGISFAVYAGEIFGLLGPNGAGKSTTLAMMEGLVRPDSGRVQVLGLDVTRQPAAVKRQIGVQLQSTSLLPDLSALEQVLLFARLYGRRLSRAGALELLERVALADRAHTLPANLSGGQAQRLALALALVNQPQIVFLDEPTAGLDPPARRSLWELVQALRHEGRTVVLTTHYMEEAETLCGRVGIIDHGKLLALDTPGGLVCRLDGCSTISTAAPLPLDALRALPGVRSLEPDGPVRRIQTEDVPATIGALQALAAQHGVALRDLQVRQPGLEDLFLKLTGRGIRA